MEQGRSRSMESQPEYEPCDECGATGWVLIELFHRQSFSVDSGYIEERPEVCQKCRGETRTEKKV